jgi:hypothetical protein
MDRVVVNAGMSENGYDRWKKAGGQRQEAS